MSAGTACLGSADGTVRAVSVKRGTTRWSVTLPAAVDSHVAVSEGQVLVASDGDDGEMFALDGATGRIRWRSPVGLVVGGGAAVLRHTVYVATDVVGEGGTGSVIALDERTGARRWLARVDDDVHSVPAVDDHDVYVGSIVTGVHAFGVATGAPRWSTDLGGGEIWSSIATANGAVYLVTDSDATYALSADSGDVLWSSQPDGARSSATMSSAAVLDGRVYVPYGDTGVICHGLRG